VTKSHTLIIIRQNNKMNLPQRHWQPTVSVEGAMMSGDVLTKHEDEQLVEVSSQYVRQLQEKKKKNL